MVIWLGLLYEFPRAVKRRAQRDSISKAVQLIEYLEFNGLPGHCVGCCLVNRDFKENHTCDFTDEQSLWI